jgi:autotransporter-associated beta strand protein
LRLVVDVTRQPARVRWQGGVDGNWDFQTNNFQLNGSGTYFVNGDTVEFDDAAAVKTVTLTDQMATAGTVFTQAQGFVLKGDGGIAGSGDLSKSGRGLLDIQNSTNSYTGKTLLTNARMQVAALADAGAESSLGLGGRGVDSLVLNQSKLLVNALSTNSNRGLTLTGSDTIEVVKANGMVTLTGLVAGTGMLVKAGSGQLNLSGSVANTYSGGTVIDGSTLALGSLTMNSSGLGTGPVTLMNGGVLSMFYNISDYNQKPTWNLTVPTGHEGSLLASGRCTINGSLSGGGTLHYDVPYVRADLVMNCSGFTGTLHATTDADGGDFRITANTNGLPLCNVQLDASVRMGAYSAIGASSTSNSTSVTVGSLAGAKGSSLVGGTWRIGNNNADAVFNGMITSGATVTKIGTGSWTLTDSSTCTTAFTVSAGRLIVSNTLKSATGSGAVTVASGAFLSGSGSIAGTTTVNGTLEGRIRFGGTLTLAGTTNLTVSGFAAGSFDVVTVAGTVSNGGTLNINVNCAAPVFGTSIKLIDATGYSGSFAVVNCPAGYAYNAATGTLTCTGYAWSGTGNWTNTANWRNGSLPASGGIILVESGLLTINQNVTTGDFLLSPAAKVTIASGFKLTVSGALTLQPTATLVDQNLSNGLAVSGGTNIQQTLYGAGANTPSGRFWYVASPVSNASSSAFAVGSSNPVNKLWSFSEATQSYTQITTSVALSPGSGYVARLGAPKTVNFSGSLPNAGNQDISVTRTGTSNVKRGFNLVGNPYPSYVELNATDNPGLENTLWFRSLTASGTSMVFDTYNILSNAQVVASGSGSLSRTIPPMQAFWVKVSTDGATGLKLAFKNANRSHQSGISLRNDSNRTGLRLRLANTSFSDETYIGLYPEANDGFDPYDSHKMTNDLPVLPEIFTFAGGEEVAINGLSVVDRIKTVPVGIRTGTAGTLTLTMTEALPADYTVFLRDKATDKVQNLTLLPEYAFESDIAVSTDRFELEILHVANSLSETVHPGSAWFDSGRHLHYASQGTIRLLDLAGNERMRLWSDGSNAVTERVFEPGVYFLVEKDACHKLVLH